MNDIEPGTTKNITSHLEAVSTHLVVVRNELEKTQETATFKELMNKLENGLLEPELLVEKIINLIKKNN